jgi:RNA polymerase sigma factor (sigma-70 family)
MSEHDWLAERFETYRGHLRSVAYRMLGSAGEADDAVQEAWLRLSRSDPDQVENLGGWLTTVVGHVCLDMLRSRKSRPEDVVGLDVASSATNSPDGADPEHEAVLADSVGVAMLVVLETLNPAERLAFVLHDMFAVPFNDIAEIIDRSPAAARQLAMRARRRIQNTDTVPDSDAARQREVVGAFLAASRGGDFDALLTVLDPDVVLRADSAAVRVGAATDVHGAAAVAAQFSGRAQAAEMALIDGAVGLVWAPGGQLRVVFTFIVQDRRIAEIEQVADAESLRGFEVAVLSE